MKQTGDIYLPCLCICDTWKRSHMPCHNWISSWEKTVQTFSLSSVPQFPWGNMQSGFRFVISWEKISFGME